VTDRRMPEPDIYASCPSDGNVLAYYAGMFDSVYVLLSPFIKPITIPKDRFCPATYPDRQEICAGCEPVSWEVVRESSGLPSIAAVDVALRTRIRGLRAEFANHEFLDRLELALQKMRVIAPNEGEHSDLLHDKVLELFQSVGNSWVWVGDEFCSERKLHWIDDLKGNDISVIAGHCNVFAPDKSILWTVHWDSHFSFLCSNGSTLERGIAELKLEGFYCQPQTEVFWSVR